MFCLFCTKYITQQCRYGCLCCQRFFNGGSNCRYIYFWFEVANFLFLLWKWKKYINVLLCSHHLIDLVPFIILETYTTQGTPSIAIPVIDSINAKNFQRKNMENDTASDDTSSFGALGTFLWYVPQGLVETSFFFVSRRLVWSRLNLRISCLSYV